MITSPSSAPHLPPLISKATWGERREQAWRARETCSRLCWLARAVCMDREVWQSASSPRQRRLNRVFGVRGCHAILYGKKDDADLQLEGALWMMLDSRPFVCMLKFQSETTTTWTKLSSVIGSGRTHRWCVAGRSRDAGRALCPAPSRRPGHEQLCSSLRHLELHVLHHRCPEQLYFASLLAASRRRCKAAEENAFLESVFLPLWFGLKDDGLICTCRI
jgi:hypothetical protein